MGINEMNKTQLINILETAKKAFLEKDVYLLEVEANERSLTHKFGEHLQAVIGDSWDVDCEYNRRGFDTKTIYATDIVGGWVKTDDLSAKTVYPDIIVHKRGPGGPNLLVIEAKKNATDKDEENDNKKLALIQEQYGYRFSVFINFIIKDRGIIWGDLKENKLV